MGNQYTVWHIRDGRDGGMGGFLCPPGHPALAYRVERGPVRNPQDIMSLMHAASEEAASYVPADIRRRAKGMLDRAVLVESEGWLRHTYGYMRSMYVSESGSRDARDLISDPHNTLPAERHAAVAAIREYFPDHQPRLDLINAGKEAKLYGSYPCVHCDQRVQYEARWDGLHVFGRGKDVCPKSADGMHAWEV